MVLIIFRVPRCEVLDYFLQTVVHKPLLSFLRQKCVRTVRKVTWKQTEDRKQKLFIVYYRRLPSVVSSSCAMFADDTLMYDHCSGINNDSSCCRLGNDVPRLDTWVSEWSTTFNASKSAHMLITGNRRLRNFSRPVSSLSISADVTPLVKSTVHLGICLPSTLSWSEHITRLIHRVQFKVFTLKRLVRRFGSESLVTRLFLSLVRPSLEYAAPAWDSCSKHDDMSLERVQLSVARAILCISRRSCTTRTVSGKPADQPVP